MEEIINLLHNREAPTFSAMSSITGPLDAIHQLLCEEGMLQGLLRRDAFLWVDDEHLTHQIRKQLRRLIASSNGRLQTVS